MDPPEIRELRRHGLRYTTDEEPGIRRRRTGKGFRYTHDSGDHARMRTGGASTSWPCRRHGATSGSARTRPATSRRPAATPGRASSTATTRGGGSCGRRKFGDLARSRRRSPTSGPPSTRTCRPGSTDQAGRARAGAHGRNAHPGGQRRVRGTNGTYGLTTLTAGMSPRTVTPCTSGSSARAEYGTTSRSTIVGLARLVRRCHELGGRELFSFVDDVGDVHRVDSGAANDYLRDHVGEEHSVKTFRTWGASALAVEHLALHPEGDVASRSWWPRPTSSRTARQHAGGGAVELRPPVDRAVGRERGARGGVARVPRRHPARAQRVRAQAVAVVNPSMFRARRVDTRWRGYDVDSFGGTCVLQGEGS